MLEKILIKDGAAESSVNWLMRMILNLPTEARSYLRVDSLPCVGFTDVRHMSYGNQDRIAVLYSADKDPDARWLLAIVCDGVGGSKNGERAASLTIASMCSDLSRAKWDGASADVLREVLIRAHSRAVHEFHAQSSTTAVAILVKGDSAAVGWVGDSRAYQVSDGNISAVTVDDTLASMVARSDSRLAFELSDEYGERLSQAIGGDEVVVPNVIACDMSLNNGFYILCTDGVWKPTEGVLGSLVASCSDGPELMRRLLLASDWLGGKDNASAILIPSFAHIFDFLNSAADEVPSGFVSICVPGNSQIVFPSFQEKKLLKPLREYYSEYVSEQNNLAPKGRKKKSAKKEGVDVEKNRRGKSIDINNQLIIAEEPLDDAPPPPSEEIQKDE